MEIELPDGTVLDAPEGANVKEVVRGYRLHNLATKNPAEYNTNSPEYKNRYNPEVGRGTSFFSGVKRVNAGLGNIERKYGGWTPLGLMGKAFPYTTDEALKSEDEIDQPLKERRPLSRAVGEIAAGATATAPLGGAGAGLEGAGVLTRTLANPLVRQALQGGIQGAAVADPNAQGKGAMTGAAISAALGKFFGVAGRTAKGLVQKTRSAEDLEELAKAAGKKMTIPLSQAGEDSDIISRTLRDIYQNRLPLIPGVSGAIKRQSEKAKETARTLFSDEADELSDDIFSEPATRSTKGQRLLTGLGLLGAGAKIDPTLAAGIFGGGNLLATSLVQKMLMGDTAAQKLAVRILAAHPETIAHSQELIRAAGVNEGAENGSRNDQSDN